MINNHIFKFCHILRFKKSIINLHFLDGLKSFEVQLNRAMCPPAWMEKKNIRIESVHDNC